MDPRFERSQKALRTAALELARVTPVDDITVSEICRSAGITRDTFYRHAASAVELLADALREQLDFAMRPHQRAAGREEFRAAERALLSHVADHADIYRNSLRPQLVAPLRANLTDALATALSDHLRRHPDALPRAVARDDASAMSMLAAYAAAGTVGAIEVWLSSSPLDIDHGVTTIIAASPEFWFAH